MEDIDNLCNSFASNMNTVDGDEIDILNEMIHKLESNMSVIELRKYMDTVSYHINRYYFVFIKDILEKDVGFKFLNEIKKAGDLYINMWDFFKKNEKFSNIDDLFRLKNASLDVWGWIKLSVNEHDTENDESEMTKLPTEVSEYMCDEESDEESYGD